MMHSNLNTEVRYRLHKLRERALIKIAWALPKSVAYWAYIRVGAYATTGEYGNTNTSELLMIDALKRWPLKESQK